MGRDWQCRSLYLQIYKQMADFKNIDKKIANLERYIRTELPTIIGVEGVNHFKESFQNEGFTDRNLQKWPQVKRRTATSPWYGFKYGSNKISNAATSRKILTGESGALADSIRWKLYANGIRFIAATKYAKIQNEGGEVKVFGRATKRIPARKFMGDSEKLRKRIVDIVIKDFKRIMK